MYTIVDNKEGAVGNNGILFLYFTQNYLQAPKEPEVLKNTNDTLLYRAFPTIKIKYLKVEVWDKLKSTKSKKNIKDK